MTHCEIAINHPLTSHCVLQHKNIQLLLAQTEKNYFEAMLKLERVSGEKQFLLKENKGLEDEKNSLRQKIKELIDENATLKEK